jgi:hypothetical protein
MLVNKSFRTAAGEHEYQDMQLLVDKITRAATGGQG